MRKDFFVACNVVLQFGQTSLWVLFRKKRVVIFILILHLGHVLIFISPHRFLI